MRKILTAALFATVAPLPAFAVQSGGYSLTVSAGAEDGNGYVRLRDGQVYQICIRSERSERSDVELNVDGLSIGTFRLNPYSNVCLERPSGSRGNFTFYKADSYGGVMSGSGVVGRTQRGLVSANFIPERAAQPMLRSAPAMGRMAAPEAGAAGAMTFGAPAPTAQQFDPNLSSGVTGLTGQSSQQFAQTQPIQRDNARAVSLELRLVHDMRQEPPVATWPQQPVYTPPTYTPPTYTPPVVTYPAYPSYPAYPTYPVRPPVLYPAPPQPQPLPGRFDRPAPPALWR